MAKKAKQSKAEQSAYTQEFRETAIKLALTGERPMMEVANELGIKPKTLYSWVSVWKKKNSRLSNTGKGSAEIELRELQKRYKQLELENEILKKASAYFAKTLL